MLVEVKDLTKLFGKLTAVDGVHFSIPAGEAFGLLGPNGAGKTTTVSMMCGLVVPSGGDVVIDGHSIRAHGVCAVSCTLVMWLPVRSPGGASGWEGTSSP